MLSGLSLLRSDFIFLHAFKVSLLRNSFGPLNASIGCIWMSSALCIAKPVLMGLWSDFSRMLTGLRHFF